MYVIKKGRHHATIILSATAYNSSLNNVYQLQIYTWQVFRVHQQRPPHQHLNPLWSQLLSPFDLPNYRITPLPSIAPRGSRALSSELRSICQRAIFTLSIFSQHARTRPMYNISSGRISSPPYPPFVRCLLVVHFFFFFLCFYVIRFLVFFNRLSLLALGIQEARAPGKVKVLRPDGARRRLQGARVPYFFPRLVCLRFTRDEVSAAERVD